MTDDDIGKGTARDPERGASGPPRGDTRAAAGRAAGKVAKKVAKKAGRKKAAKKTAATTGKTAKKAAGTTTKRDKPAPPRAAAPASGTTTAGVSAARPKAATRAAAPAAGVTAASGAAASGAASVPAAPAALPHEAGSSMEAPRPPAPMHPGAYTDPAQEGSGGLGSLLTLWGPLIIVGFLVLIFRGGVERGDTVAAVSDAPAPPAEAADTPAPIARGPQAGGTAAPAGARSPERAPDPPGAGRKVAEAFDRGFTMRASMAGGPAFADREPGAPMPAGSPGRLYPSPPGPYRDPRYRGLPTDERWPAAGAGDWVTWSAGAREDAGPEDGGDAPAQWVRCAPPYYWCPAPVNPTW